jgi:hypothetical protein
MLDVDHPIARRAARLPRRVRAGAVGAATRADARLEKQSEFESTDTYRAVKRVYQARQGTRFAYARMPQVTLRSPKLSRERTTAWFAESVDRRFNTCLARLPKDART